MTKAVLVGAAGGIGQPLALLLKLCNLIDELALVDVVPVVRGVAADLAHISTKAKITPYVVDSRVEGYLEKAKEAYSHADIVIVPAGVPRKPGMTRDDLFKINASIVQGIAALIAQFCPAAYVLMISNPVNSTVPVTVKYLQDKNVFNSKKVFGVTTLDLVRAETFLAEKAGISDASKLYIPVIGGHSEETIVPLFSQTQPKVNLEGIDLNALSTRVQFGGKEIVDIKDEVKAPGSATLSMAYAGFRFAEKVLRARNGETGLVESAYVYLPGLPGAEAIQAYLQPHLADENPIEYFSVPVELGAGGISKVVDVTKNLSDKEVELLKEAIKVLPKQISKGVDFKL